MPQLSANGIELEYEVTGDGPPLLLIMGLGMQLVHWPDVFVSGLVERGFRVIRYDNRDVGLSTKLHGQRGPGIREALARRVLHRPIAAPYTLGDMADDASALLAGLGIESAHVLGISMGGMIGQVLAARHPRRVRTLTSLMSTTGALRHVSRLSALRALLAPPGKTREEAIERGIATFRVLQGRRFKLNEPKMRERLALAYDRCYYPAGFRRHFLAILAGGNRTLEVSTIRTPTLVIHGADDPLVPPSAGRATARAIPGATLRIVEGLGHSLPDDASPLIAEEIARHALSTEPAGAGVSQPKSMP